MNKLTQNSVIVKQGQGEEVWLTRKELQQKTARSEGYFRKLRKQNKVKSRLSNGNGGERCEYLLSSLPEDIKKYFPIDKENISVIPEIKKQFSSLVNRERNYLTENDNSNLNELSKKDEVIALNRSALVCLYMDSYTGKTDKKKHQLDFVKSYNLNLPTFQNIYQVLGEVTFQTLNRWRKIYIDANKDFRSLAPNYLKNRGDNIPEIQKDILLKTVLNPNKILISEVVRFCIPEFRKLGHTKILSDKTYRNYLNKWRAENLDKWTFYREGNKALTDNVLSSLKRDRELVEVGEIIVGDGHVLNFRIVDPFDGKMKRMQFNAFFDFRSGVLLGYDISHSENQNSIKTALFRSILFLGKIPQVIYLDNGKAFNSKLFTDYRGIFERLGMKLINATAYSGQSKPIERFFRSFGELERRISSYVGTSIKDKPAHMLRGEKVHRAVDKIVNPQVVTIHTAYDAVASWLVEFHSRPTKSLKGKTPKEVFELGKGPGVNKLQLMFLMMNENNVRIKRGTIKLFGEEYSSNHFYGIEKEIVIRYDLIDMKATGTVYCFDSKTGAFICTATRKKMLHPAAGILGSENDVRNLEKELKNRSTLKAFTTKDAKSFLKSEIIPTVQKQIAVAEIEREKNEAIEIKKTGTDDFDFSLDFLKHDKSASRKENNPRTWFD